jgi:ATP-dependent DNA helicase RecQ
MEKMLDYLKQYWKSNAFRPLQEEVIQHYLKGKDTLVLMPTGGGKSICYQLPALLNEGQTLVISPLISLMQDQVNQLNQRGIKSMFFESQGGKNDIYRQLENARNGNFKLIYCSPERLTSEEFLLQLEKLPIKGIAIDEAHCVSEWGHDFRPAFRLIKNLRPLFPHTPFMALTATATPKVLKDIHLALGLNHPKTFSTSFERKNIQLEVRQVEDKMGTLKKLLTSSPSESVIVYCRSRSKTEHTAQQLQRWGLKAGFYHGGLEARQKKQILEDWKAEVQPIMVATNAFGMGIDKSNVRKVIHLIMPESMESYYQETGRAGRDGLPSVAVLLVHPADKDRLENQFLSHLPDSKYLKRFFKKLCDYLHISYGEGEGEEYRLSLKDFCNAYNFHPKKAQHCFGILDREGVLEMQYIHETQTHLKIKCSPSAALSRTEQGDDAARILQFLMRNYEELFRKEKKINLGQVVDLLGLGFDEIQKQMSLMNKENIMEYKQSNTDIKLFWKVPREDQYTLNPFLKRTAAHNQLKIDKIAFMLDYAFEKFECKRNKILQYFGEKKSDNCQQCSARSCQKNSSPNTGVRLEIKKILAEEAQNAYQIGLKIGTSNDSIVIALHDMMEENIIGLNEINQFYLK